MSAPEKIAIRSVNWLGDAIMSMPAVQRLKQAKPQAEITVLTREKLADLWRLHPDVADVISVTPQESIFQVARRLKWGAFGTGVVLPNSPRSAIELWLARIPKRIGFSRGWRNLFLTHKVSAAPQAVTMHKRSAAEIRRLIQTPGPAQQFAVEAHQVHHYLRLVAESFEASAEPTPPRLAVAEPERQRFKTKFKLPGGVPLFGLNAGAEYGPAKRWGEERYSAAAIALHKQTGCHWLVFGGPGDRQLAERITGQVQDKTAPKTVTNLAGQTTLAELCAGLACCLVLVTNDSGPMHVGAAVGTPVVVPFGSTSPDLTGPSYGVESGHRVLRAQVPCSPCFLRECPIDLRCMASITVEQVVLAVLNLTRAAPEGRHRA